MDATQSPAHTASDFTPIPPTTLTNTWYAYAGSLELTRTERVGSKVIKTRQRITTWSDVAVSAPSPNGCAYFRVQVECDACGGSGVTERELPGSYPQEEPLTVRDCCEECSGDGFYATEATDEQGTALWLDLMARDEMPAKVWLAATMRAVSEEHEAERLCGNAEAAQ